MGHYAKSCTNAENKVSSEIINVSKKLGPEGLSNNQKQDYISPGAPAPN